MALPRADHLPFYLLAFGQTGRVRLARPWALELCHRSVGLPLQSCGAASTERMQPRPGLRT